MSASARNLPASTNRERLLSLIKSNPGIHIRRLSHLTGLSWNTCLHHLRAMERGTQVTSRKVQGKVCWFDATEGAIKGKVATCLLRDPDNLKLAHQVLATPGHNQSKIAASLAMAASVVHRRLTAMEEAGLVVRMPQSRSVHVFPTQELTSAATKPGFAPRNAEWLIAPEDLAASAAAAKADVPAPVAHETSPDAAGRLPGVAAEGDVETVGDGADAYA